MELTYTILTLSIIQLSLCFNGDPMLVTPFDGRTASTYPVVARFPSERTFVPQQTQTLIHTNTPATGRAEQSSPENFTFNEFLEALNEASQHHEDEQFRAASRDDTAYSYSHPTSYGYPAGGNYAPATATGYHKPEGYAPTANSVSAKLPILKPELLDLVKPVTTKVSSKMNGLVGLVMSLLTGAVPGGLQLNGFKDLLINGILKPLFVVKGGIKALISKLAIPVISLLLINLEVLITVWWLWEVCPEKTPPYPYKPSPEYNSYS